MKHYYNDCNTMHKYHLSFDLSCIVGVCTNKPTPWAINNGWTCQTYVNNGLDMTKYCKSATWKVNKNCGITCAKFGMVTDPNCDDGKAFLFTNDRILYQRQ